MKLAGGDKFKANERFLMIQYMVKPQNILAGIGVKVYICSKLENSQ